MARSTKIRAVLLGAVAAVAAAGAAAPAQAGFGLVPGSFQTSLSEQQAGAAGDYTLAAVMNQKDPANASSDPDGTIRDLDLQLPVGMVADPTPWAACDIGQVVDAVTKCPITSAVGTVSYRFFFPALHIPFFLLLDSPLFRVKPQGNEAAAFAFPVFGQFPVRLGVTVDPVNGYRIRSRSVNTNEGYPLLSFSTTLWGTPEDHQGPGPLSELGSPVSYGGPLDSTIARHRFLSVPTRCGGGPLDTTLGLRPWQTDQASVSYTSTLPAVTGCDHLPFDPKITVTPASRRAGQPTGYRVELAVPQNEDPDGLTTPNLKDAVVRLPAGVAISAPQADGLNACSDAQLDLSGGDRETCPDASKIGTLKIDTPVLDDPVNGSVYIGTQQSGDPESGEMYRIFLTAHAPGVQIKLRGQVKADPATGQLTATFTDNPQVPFSKFTLDFKGGDRATLVNPPACGSYTTTTALSSWGGQSATPSDALVIDQDCASTPFAPTLAAGPADLAAGRSSTFTLRATRADGQPDMSGLQVTLPPGLVGDVGSVPLCGEAQAAAGTCAAASQIGRTTVLSGAGASPLEVPQPGKAPTHVYLAGPYKGAPFSLSVVVPAQAGPFDLGTVVVRAAVFIDPNDAHVTVKSDPLPTILGGVPLKMQQVIVTLDRPGFMRNPTTCEPQEIAADLQAAGGAAARVASPFQVAGCDALAYAPRVAITLSGKGQTTDGKHPALTAKLSMAAGQANNKKIKVALPLSLALDPDNANGLCEPVDAAGNRCPAASIVGHVKAISPILGSPLNGPVYFVRGERKDPKSGRTIRTLPKLYVPLTGADGVQIDLHADSEVVDDRLVTTFDNIPDAPVSDVTVDIDGGQHGILVVSATDICQATQIADGQYDGQSGKIADAAITMGTPCKLAVVGSGHSKSALRLKVGGIGAGKVTVSGHGLVKTSRSISTATVATLSARLSKATREALAAHRNVKVKVTISYLAKGAKKATKATKSLVIHGAKKAGPAKR